jgi:hypothetical protein
MHFPKYASPVAAILATAILMLATAAQDRAAAQPKVLGATCAPGFTANALSQSANTYVCQSSVIVCPMRPGMNVSAQPLAPIPSQNGVTLRYQCAYRPMTASPR